MSLPAQMPDAALTAFGLGFEIFPLIPRGKVPPKDCKWREYQAADEEIELWGNRNYGIKTGRVVVIDADSLEAVEFMETGPVSRSFFVVKTANGKHFYYRVPENVIVKNLAGRKKLDIRGNGGYVVGPGSTHETGAIYEIEFDQIDMVDDLTVLSPEDLKTIFDFNGQKESETKPSAPETILQHHQVSDIKAALHYIDAEDRDPWLAAGMALHATGAGEQAFGIWAEWSAQSGKFDPKVQRSTWLAFADRDEQINLPSLFRLAKQGGYSGTPLFATDKDEPPEFIRPWRVSVFEGAPPERKFLVDETIPAGKPGIMAGTGGTGKSMALLQFGLAVTGAVNETIFHHPITTKGAAVIITAEDDYQEVWTRLAALDPDQHYLNSELFVVPLPSAGGRQVFVSADRNGTYITEEYKAIARELLSIKDLQLVVFDPLQAFTTADITSDANAAQAVCSLIAELAAESEATVLFSHHMRKSPHAKPIHSVYEARDAIRGSSGLVDGVRFAYALWHMEAKAQVQAAEKLRIKHKENQFLRGALVKANFRADMEVQTLFRNENGALSNVTEEFQQEMGEWDDKNKIYSGMVEDDAGPDAKVAALVDFVKKKWPKKINKREAADYLMKEFSISQSTAYRLCAKVISTGAMNVVGGASNYVFQPWGIEDE